MDIRTLLNRVDVIENNQLSLKKYISESLYNTPEMQPHWKRIDEGFVRGYEQYLAEVALTPEQIQSIFKQASGGAAAGEAPKDPGKLAALVDKVLPADQAGNLEKTLPEPNAGPVQGFEQKAASAIQNIQGADSATKQSLMQWIKQGVAKPETQQLILAAVGAGVGGLISKVGPILSMIPGGGPVAAAVTGAIIAGAVSVASAKLQGKDWKTAFKGAIKPALMGGASAVIGNLATTAVGAMMGGGNNADQAAGQETGKQKGASLGVGQELPDGEVISALDSSNPNSGVTITRPDGSTYSVSRDTAQAMTGQTGISPQATGPVSQGASSDPGAGVTDGGGKRGNSGWDSMKGNTNADGSPMTLDQINQAKADLRAGNASSVAAPAGGNQAAFDKEWAAANADQDAAQALAGKTGADFAGTRDANGVAPYATGSKEWAADRAAGKIPDLPVNTEPAGIQPKGGWGAQEKINQTMQAKVDADYAAQQAGGATAPGINRLTGNQFQAAPSWDQMTPDQQAATTAKQQQQAADAAAGTQNAKDYWANKPSYTRGLKESFTESAYIDKQATLRMWLDQEARGLAVSGLSLKPIVKEGIMDFFKGKGKGAAPAAGGVTADALNKAWAAAGNPTDSEEVAKVLQSAGVPPETVTKVFTDLKLPAPTGKIEPKMDPAAAAAPGAAQSGQATAAPGADQAAPTSAPVNTQDLLAQILKLDPAQQKEVLAYLKK